MRRSLTGKIWNIRGRRAANESMFDAFCRIRNFTPAFFAEAALHDLAPPENLPGVRAATERILAALRAQEKILIFGDFDLDGMSGAALLHLALRSLGADVSTKLPSRSDGYGLSKAAFQVAQETDITLVITVDCGSANAAEIEFGKTLGIDTIISDHHTLPDPLPNPVALVHPHLGTPTDDTWGLTGAGVAFFLAKSLLEKTHPAADISPMLTKLAELAILGTVADVGQLTGQNRVLLKIGLKSLAKTKHPGLLALFQSANIRSEDVTAETIAFYLAPRLNAAGRVAHPEWSLQLLLGDPRYSVEYSAQLDIFHGIRRDMTEQFMEIAEQVIGQDGNTAMFHAVFHPDFTSGIAGLVAARIAEKYACPAIALSPTDDPEMLTASCRGPVDFHFAEALREVTHLLAKHGGHAQAAGFLLEKKKLAEFREAFAEVVQAKRGDIKKIPEIDVDMTAVLEDFVNGDFEAVLCAAPFGAGNPDPLFLLENVTLDGLKHIGKDQSHLVGNVIAGQRKLSFIAFRFVEYLPETLQNGRFDVLVNAEFRVWNGRKNLQLKVVDMREHGK